MDRMELAAKFCLGFGDNAGQPADTFCLGVHGWQRIRIEYFLRCGSVLNLTEISFTL
jgi:hypothetical protein